MKPIFTKTGKDIPTPWYNVIVEEYRISEREWGASLNRYEGLGSKILPPYAILDPSWDLIQQDKLQEAADKLSSHYRIDPPLMVRKKARDKEAGEYENGQIFLYPRAFEKDKPDRAYTVYHEFAHHLQNRKYPFTGKVGELQKKDRKYVFMQRDLFAMRFAEGCIQRLGFVVVRWKRPD